MHGGHDPRGCRHPTTPLFSSCAGRTHLDASSWVTHILTCGTGPRVCLPDMLINCRHPAASTSGPCFVTWHAAARGRGGTQAADSEDIR
eukprot:767620-Hanusia_phi.AAC.7